MKQSVIFLVMIALTGIAMVMFITKNYLEPQQKTFNCGLLVGGWHPDVPQHIQEYCRKRSTTSEQG